VAKKVEDMDYSELVSEFQKDTTSERRLAILTLLLSEAELDAGDPYSNQDRVIPEMHQLKALYAACIPLEKKILKSLENGDFLIQRTSLGTS
jgi:hypothetical protein